MSRDALIVGINCYSHSKFGNLKAPATDAEAIAQRLEQHGRFTTVKRLPEAIASGNPQVAQQIPVTRKQMREAIVQLFNPPSSDQVPDTALLYFSGHGWKKAISATEGYLAPSNGDPEDDYGVELQWLRDQLEQSAVRQQIVWLDCCSSGTLLNFGELTSTKGGKVRDRYFITSSRDFEASYEDLASPYSVLTAALLEGLDPSRGDVTSGALTHSLEQRLKGQIQGFRCHSTSGSMILTFGTVPPESQVAQKPAPQSYRNRAIPLQMPPLPDHFVERPEHQEQVKQQLLCEDARTYGTLVVSAIYGLGGIGKSVLASKLAHDDQVQARFCDGILWATLGQSPDILPLLSGWIQALGDNDFTPTAIESASNHLRTLLYDKRALVIVDDVWNPDHLEPFRVGGTGCCVLVTTREARISEAHRYDLDVMSPEQALELMTQKLSEALSEADRQQALAFAQRVGYLPLALELAASQIEEGVSWTELFEDFRDEVARLEGLDLYGREDIPDDAKRRRYSLLACFNLSLKQLSLEQLRQFAWLGIVPEDVSLTQEMAVMLWQVTARQAGSILRTFSAKALLLQGVKRSGNRRTYRMHDLMHDLAQRLLISPPQPLEPGDLPGLGLTKAEAHSEFLQRYRARTDQGQWHTLADDGYIFAQLTWHLEQARQPQEIHRLLAASNGRGQNGWFEACEAIGKPAGFVNDLGRAWRLAVENYQAAPGETLVLLWRYALIRGSLNSLASNVPGSLVGALVQAEVWSPAQGLAYAQQAQNPWQRAACIAAIVPYMPEALLDEVLRAVAGIRDAAYRSYVLAELAERFPQFWPEVLETIRQIQDRFGNHRHQNEGFSYRAFAITQLSSKLPASYLGEVLDLARSMNDVADRAEALVALAERQPDLLPEVLEVTREIKDEWQRAYALIDLSKQLPELLPEALELTRDIKNEQQRAYALRDLSKQLPELLPEALELTRELKEEWQRAFALIEISKQLPELLPEALEVTRELKEEWERAFALRELSKQLPELLPEALEVTRNIKDEWQRADALRELSKQLPELLPEALEVTRELKDEGSRADALRELSKQLPELLPEALEVTREIKDEGGRADALIELSKQLPELLPEALEVTRDIKAEWRRADALIELSKQLPELLPEALEVTRDIKDERQRASALRELSKQLPELLPEALEVTRELKDEWQRAWGMRKLSEQLPELLPEALEVTRGLKEEWQRADALVELSKQLPELLPEALEVTRELKDERQRALQLWTLIRLCKQLFPELLSEVLGMASQLKDESSRAIALSGLAEHLPPELLPQSLQAAWNIQDPYFRAKALQGFLPHLLQLTPTFPDWAKTLDTLAYQNRSALLKALPKIRPLILLHLSNDATFSTLLQTTRDICKQWP